MKLLALLILICTSCGITTNVVRTDRHHRRITVYVTYCEDSRRGYSYLRHKARAIGCDKLEVIELTDARAVGVCEDGM